ncbi:MAG TPA: amino acid adenylation domain-containing protein [Lacunisphaera sp.]|jgi:amino acid adenylation domain-containing protein|nr:amino acid adenylation domain-containing protein [Lacunisphaera sp.]
MPAAIATQSYPLSPLQEGMLAHHAGRVSGGIDLVQIVVHLPEPLAPDAWEESWRRAASRHAILRTTIATDEPAGTPCQRVAEAVAMEWSWLDWRHLEPVVRDQWWGRLLANDRQRGFDLKVAPLWRGAVVQLGPNVHRILFTFHHLLLDARAVFVLFNEVFAACDALQAGHRPVDEPAVPYRSYIDWLGRQDTAAASAYWRTELAGFHLPTPMPAIGGAADAPAGALTRHLALSRRQTLALRAFAQAEGVTIGTLLHGAWALLLHRYTGEEDVVFGAVRTCRRGGVPDADRIVGLMINTVPLRVPVSPEDRIGPWLRALRAKWVAHRAHEHTPPGVIREASEVAPGNPLFDTVVSYQEPGWDADLRAQGGAWEHRVFEVHNQPGHPLAVDVAGGAALDLRITYDTSVYGAAAIDRMLGHLAALLTGLATHAPAPLRELPLLSSAEQRTLLVEWNGQAVDFDDQLCLHHRFEREARRDPDALAVADEHEALSYGELDRRAAALARRLLRHGAGPNRYVGVCLDASTDLVVALLGILKSGAAYVPMDPAYPAARLAFIVRDSGMPLLVTDQAHAAPLAAGPARLLLLDGPADDERSAIREPDTVSTPDHLAYLIYTSGSTGVPKGVPIRHRSVANLVDWHQQTYEVSPRDRATQVASPAFDACVWELWPYLTAGASIHIPDGETRQSPGRLVRWLAHHRITLCFLPTPLAEATFDEDWPAGMPLRAILTGGDRLRRRPADRLPCALVNHYGPTECTVVATWAPVAREGDGHAPAIGRPIANTEAFVLDRHDRLVPIGVPGELHLGGAGMADGYHGRPELTAQKFVPHPCAHGPSRRLYRTGDLVRWREDGQLDYLGRLDHQLKIRGHRIEPGEIESILNDLPGVRESLVVLREDEAGQPQLVAYFLPAEGGPVPEPEHLVAQLHRRLPVVMVPAACVGLEAWPLTPNGKVDRAALPPPPAPVREFIAPQPGLETTIARIWNEVLGRRDLSADDDFFLSGGHSLRAAQVISRLNAALGATLTVRQLFEHSTIAGLAAFLGQRSEPISTLAQQC